MVCLVHGWAENEIVTTSRRIAKTDTRCLHIFTVLYKKRKHTPL